MTSLHSANILLDDDLQPKLSDFGLARLRPHSTSQHCTITLDTSYHSNLGYLPEEYIRDGKLSFSLDVYSFGMVIIKPLYLHCVASTGCVRLHIYRKCQIKSIVVHHNVKPPGPCNVVADWCALSLLLITVCLLSGDFGNSNRTEGY